MAFPDAFLTLVASPDAAGQYLVEIDAYIGGEARSGGLAGLAEIPLAATPTGSGIDVGEVTINFADRHWVGLPERTFDFSGGTMPSGASMTRNSVANVWKGDGTVLVVAVDTMAFPYAFDGSVWSLEGALNRAAATNIIVNSRAFNTASWTAVNGATSASVTGVDGSSKRISATDSSTTSQASFRNTPTIPADTAIYAGRCLVPKTVGATFFPALLMYFVGGGGSPQVAAVILNTNTGVGTDISTGGTSLIEDGDDYWIVHLKATNDGIRTSIRFEVRPAASTDGTSLTNVAVGTTVVDFIEVRAGTVKVDGPFIESGSSAGTLAATVLTLDVDDAIYDITITRADGDTVLSDQTVAGGYTVPVDNSPVVSVVMTPTLADTFYEGRCLVPLVIDRQLPLLPEEDRRVQRQIGAIEFANGDGEMDVIVQSYAIDGRDVTVRFGPLMGLYEDFGVIASVVATGWEAGDETVRLNLRDRAYSLDTPLQTTLYSGAGGVNGTAEIEGKPKPLAFGIVRNATPVLIDPTNLIYQVHDGQISAVDAVYDQGAALTEISSSPADSASYAALVGQSVGAGEYGTCLAEGLFKLGSSPSGVITCDVHGDADPSYIETLDDVALRILEDRAGLASSLIDDASFAAVATAGEIGLYISQNETPTTAAVLSRIMATVAGSWGATRAGLIAAYVLADPAAQDAEFFLDEYDILTLEQEATGLPRWRQRVGYQVNWTVQRGEDLAGGVTDARRQFLAEAVRVVTAADADTLTRHLQAADPTAVVSLYDDSTDAQSLADDLLALHSPDRRIFRATVKRIGFRMDLGSIVNLTWPRQGLAAGKNFAVIGIREDADRDEITLRLWG